MSDYRVVKTYEEVRKSISNFNRDLEGSDVLKSRLSSVRAWDYVPEEDAVGPSKFIGYNGMTEKKYVKFTSGARCATANGSHFSNCDPMWWSGRLPALPVLPSFSTPSGKS